MTYHVKPKNDFMSKLAWWFILMGALLCVYVWCSYFDELDLHQRLIKQSHMQVYYIKHSNDEVEKTTKDVEKYFFAVPWEGKFGTKWYDYYKGVVNKIAEIIQYNGYKTDEFGAKISLLVDGNGEYFIFLQMKLYKTGYEGQFYTEWYISEHGSKAPDVTLPNIPFMKPRKPEPKDDKTKPKEDFPNFDMKHKGDIIFL